MEENLSEAKVRLDLVNTAVKFLNNMSVAVRPENEKVAFLKKKGLSEDEIKSAFSQATALLTQQFPAHAVPSTLPVQQYSMWLRIKDLANTFIFLWAVAYGVHYFYQHYVGPWLTGHKTKTTEDAILEVKQSVAEIMNQIQSVTDMLERNHTEQEVLRNRISSDKRSERSIETEIKAVKSEVVAIRSMMLNRKTFPATPAPAACIPSWQLNALSNGDAVPPPTVNTDTDNPVDNSYNPECTEGEAHLHDC